MASVDERQIVELETAVARDNRKALDAGHCQKQPVKGIAVVRRKIAQGFGSFEIAVPADASRQLLKA
jgi:hypothetical protein